MQVLHHPRVAWDMARLIVAAVPDERLFDWLCTEVGALLGPEHAGALRDTRWRLQPWARTTPDAAAVEAGRWRVRLEDLLRTRPETAEPLRSLTVIASGLHRDRIG
ncbi:hypothetical protein [Micromonospora sp. HUAS LYJ1]|uniref:hypothetical protein n=1 Tax=Micromonospora sp. HUAS LYJ1 TaxID=3061626 RepID=UPI002671771F|nr:hypothetical protein [Micromonospora sp. HUAS LYJ1]WKU04418.1 hypothetical protein Q2K16_26995 [Micromonospora sp. HUAS LYJ1]